jgi:hypothetical protein
MNFKNVLTRGAGSAQLALKKNAPTILTGAGVIGFAVTTALAIRATGKAVQVMPEIHKDIAMTKMKAEDEEYTEKEAMEAVVRTYAKSSLVLAEIYWPVLVAGSASIVCVLAGHGMMRRRQASLVAAYTMLDASYKAYRARIRERFGEDVEREAYTDIKAMRIFDEEGNEHLEIDSDDVLPSMYARFFDSYNKNWSKTTEWNLLFLRAQQDWANDKLRSQGHLFLNEVYDALGMERSQAGQLVGWKYESERGDSYVDFGLYLIGDEGNRAFVNLIEPTVKLDFNVDGVIGI